tara:strand:- start:14 stop:181 length:168 start_codon:yes stop_codon:yes gene_type:complete
MDKVEGHLYSERCLGIEVPLKVEKQIVAGLAIDVYLSDSEREFRGVVGLTRLGTE